MQADKETDRQIQADRQRDRQIQADRQRGIPGRLPGRETELPGCSERPHLTRIFIISPVSHLPTGQLSSCIKMRVEGDSRDSAARHGSETNRGGEGAVRSYSILQGHQKAIQ